MHLNYPELVYKHPAHLASPVKCSQRRFSTVELPGTHVEELYTPCHLCNDVVREGLRRFDVLDLPRG